MPRAGTLIPEAQKSFEPEAANQKPFSWGSKGAILFCEREWPLCFVPLCSGNHQLPRSGNLFTSPENFTNEFVNPLRRGDVQPLVHGVNIVQLRSHGQRVEAGDLFDEEAALKAAVGGFDLPVAAGEVAVDLLDLLAERRIAVILPTGIVAALRPRCRRRIRRWPSRAE